MAIVIWHERCTRLVMPTILWIVLILILLGGIGSLPMFPYSTGWGYYPSGGLGLLLVILVVVLVLRGGGI